MDKDLITLLGDSVDLAKPVVETGCRLVESLLGGPCRVVGDMLADQIYAWQWTNRLRIFSLARQKLDQTKVAPNVLPPGFLIPLLNESGNVEDPDLQDMWAQLVSSGMQAEHRHPAFVAVLRQLSRDEAVCLVGDEKHFRLHTRPNPSSPAGDLRMSCLRWFENEFPGAVEGHFGQSELDFYSQHVSSLGLGTLEPAGPTHLDKDFRRLPNPSHYELSVFEFEWRLTAFGKAFVAAVTGPQDRIASLAIGSFF